MSIIEEARRGIITEEMKKISELERLPVEKIRVRIAEGKITVIRNYKMPKKKLIAIGKGLATKININIGTSSEVIDLQMEIEKVKVANRWRDTIMDLSTGGDLDHIRREIIKA
jgi:phosphomethylpyrimidine synthase